MTTFYNFALNLWFNFPKRAFGYHSPCFPDIQYCGFNCVLLIIKIAGLETSRPTFLGEKFDIISWNRLIFFNGDMRCVLLISFLVQNHIISDNSISMWLWWMWNSAFWLEVENLRKLATIVSYKPLSSLSQENRKTLASALLDTSTT